MVKRDSQCNVIPIAIVNSNVEPYDPYNFPIHSTEILVHDLCGEGEVPWCRGKSFHFTNQLYQQSQDLAQDCIDVSFWESSVTPTPTEASNFSKRRGRPNSATDKIRWKQQQLLASYGRKKKKLKVDNAWGNMVSEQGHCNIIQQIFALLIPHFVFNFWKSQDFSPFGKSCSLKTVDD